MHRNYFCAEVVILLLLSQVGWNGPSTTLVSCPWDKSQIVRSVIQKKFFPILDRYRVAMPLDCPFNSRRDIFWWPSKSEDDQAWICPGCGQKFICSESLESHWEKVHRMDINRAEDAVCLADYCDIMRCDVLGWRFGVGHDQRSRDKEFKNKNAYNFVKSNVIHWTLPCNETDMSLLQNKCRAVIRQCTVGLLSGVSLKDFQDIEDDLNKAICSYLTCDRYWDDSLQEIRHVPILFCVVLGIILVGGFCLCYYVVWVLFDGSPQEEVYHSGLHFSNCRIDPRYNICVGHRHHRRRLEHYDEHIFRTCSRCQRQSKIAYHTVQQYEQ